MHTRYRPTLFFAPDDGAGDGTPQDGDGQELPAPATNVEDLPDWAQKQINDLRAESAKHRVANKELTEKATRLDEIEDASKSELEKLTEKATTAEQRAEALEAQLLRLEIAAEKGLSKKQAARLQGKTREELEADADELIEVFGSKAKSRVEPNLKPAGAGDELPDETDPAKLAARIARR